VAASRARPEPPTASASSGSSAIAGTYDFVVSRLVGSQQVITRGFSDTGTTAIAPGGATFTFESAAAGLSTDTQLNQLNGGNGTTRGKIRITDRSGASTTVDLSRALTVNDVLDQINSADGINVIATAAGDGLVLTDNTGSTSATLSVAEVSGGTTAASLGLNVAAVDDVLTGSGINTIGNATTLTSLNDGNGVSINNAQNDLAITTRDGNTFNVNLADATTIGDVIDAIETASAGSVTVATSGGSLELTDNTAGGSTFSIAALNSSKAAADLGILTSDGDADGVITGSRVRAGLNSRLLSNLNGGAGVTLGIININNRNSVSTDIDLSSADSVDDAVRLINNAGAGVTAAINATGNGITLTDTTGATAGNLTGTDVSGTGAADLNLAQDVDATTIDSGNLNLRYVSESTLLTNLNGGKGITVGQFTITDSAGASATVDLTQGNETTVSDVLAEINSRGLALTARINDTGDGILIEDTGPGTLAIKVEEAGSTTARDLGLLGEAANPGDALDGRFEKSLTIATDDTLDDILTKINEGQFGVSATIINDGSGTNPFRLSLQATKSGKSGAFLFGDGGLNLGATTLSQAQDAVAFFGSGDPAKGIAITSKTNQLNDVVPGVTIDLKTASNSPVQVVISEDTSSPIEAVRGFVEDFNAVISAVDKHDKFDSETLERGLLFGDPTTSRVKSLLFDIVNRRNNDLTGQFNSLTQIGVRVSGGQLTFDEARFQEALNADPGAVQALFTFKETETDQDTNETTTVRAGIGVRIDELLERLTNTTNGVLQTRLDSLDDQIELNTERIERLNTQLEAKRERLLAEFVAMERALAQLQGQSNALANFQPIAVQQPSSGGILG